MRFIFFFFLLFHCFSIYGADLSVALGKISEDNIFLKKKWKKLLHYNRSFFSMQSDIDDEGFFLSSDGRSNLKSEMVALVTELYENTNIQCRFPARVKWMSKFIPLPSKALDFSNCKKYLKFKSEQSVKTVYLVFSSYYLESPASAFGHTFLRFSSNEKMSTNKRSELLDAGMSYGAQVTSDNPVLYAILGMVGGFKGTYSILPYFYKVREYNDFESRDLWAYQLNLTEKDIEVLIDHLWEVGNSWSSYFFFTENCSYNMLTMLEVINPSWNLVDQLYFYVIPSDTIKAISSIPGLVTNISFRPSIKKIFEKSFKQLTKEEKVELDFIIDNLDISKLMQSTFSSKSKSKILDVVINYIDYKHSDEILKEKGTIFDWKMKVLMERSVLPKSVIDRNIKMPLREIPHTAHASRRFEIGMGYNNDLKLYESIGLRLSFHDLLDPVQGSPEYASITFGHININFYNEDKKVSIDEFTFVEVQTLNPISYRRYPFSLKAKLFFGRDSDETCSNCMGPHLFLSSGITKSFSGKYISSFFLNSDFSRSGGYKYGEEKIAIGPSVQTIFRWRDNLTNKISAGWNYFAFQEGSAYILNHEFRYHLSKSYSISLINKISESNVTHSLKLLIYN